MKGKSVNFNDDVHYLQSDFQFLSKNTLVKFRSKTLRHARGGSQRRWEVITASLSRLPELLTPLIGFSRHVLTPALPLAPLGHVILSLVPD